MLRIGFLFGNACLLFRGWESCFILQDRFWQLLCLRDYYYGYAPRLVFFRMSEFAFFILSLNLPCFSIHLSNETVNYFHIIYFFCEIVKLLVLKQKAPLLGKIAPPLVQLVPH